VSKFEQLRVLLQEILLEAEGAGLPFIFSLGDYHLQQEGSTQHATGVAIHDDEVHVILDHVRDVVLFTPVPLTEDTSSYYYRQLRDLLFKWHNATHTEKLVEKDGQYEWAK
jgi:hypothetical protein